MIHRDNIREFSRIGKWAGIAGILYCAYNTANISMNNPTPLVQEYNIHEHRLRVLTKKQYLEHLTGAQEKEQIEKEKYTMQQIEQNPAYFTQKNIQQIRKQQIHENDALLFVSIGLLVGAGTGYLLTKEKKKKPEAPYKLEFS